MAQGGVRAAVDVLWPAFGTKDEAKSPRHKKTTGKESMPGDREREKKGP